MPAVSVIMPVHNAGPFVRQAVSSVLAQTFVDFELIIADDCSTDGCLDFLTELDDDRIRLLPSPPVNTGAAPTRNRALEAARAPLVALADADDMVHPLRLELQVQYLLTHPEISLVAGATHVFGSRMETPRISWPVTTHELLTLGLRYGPSFYHGSVMVRTDALRSIDGYRDVPPTEDYDMYARLLLGGHRFAAIGEVVLVYRSHEGGISKARADEAARVHRVTSDSVRRDVAIPSIRSLTRAARQEPRITPVEPRLRAAKLLGRTAIELVRTRPLTGVGLLMVVLSMGPGAWRDLLRSSRSGTL